MKYLILGVLGVLLSIQALAAEKKVAILVCSQNLHSIKVAILENDKVVVDAALRTRTVLRNEKSLIIVPISECAVIAETEEGF